MNPLIKFVLIATAAVSLFFVFAGAALAFALYRSGTVHVQVIDVSPHSSVDIDLPVPAGLVAGLFDLVTLDTASGGRLLHRHRLDGRHGFHDCHDCHLDDWAPAFRAACDALADGPDGTLIDIAEGSETVRISKHGDQLDIQVREPGTNVHVTAPAGLLHHLANVV